MALDEVDDAEDGVVEGELRIDFRDGAVTIGPGEMFVVPKGVVNTGDAGGEMTAKNDVWV